MMKFLLFRNREYELNFARKTKRVMILEKMCLIKSMIIILRLSYDDGKSLRVILMRINLGIMIEFYWSTMKL